MSLAHLAGQPVVERRGVIVRPLGEWEEGAHLTHSPPESVPALCYEFKQGITSANVSRILGINVKAASTYLGRLCKDGLLEVERTIINKDGGRPTNVYRVKGV